MTEAKHETKLARLLTDASLQALFMRSRRQDLLDQAKGVKFLYGVDANVIRHWGNPRSHRANRFAHIGRIFRNDSDELATATFWGLLSFIFDRRLPPENIPLLIIPPIETELAAILEALHDSDPDRPNAAVRMELDRINDQLKEQLTAAQLSKLNLKLQDLLLQEVGEHGELRRILLLLTRSIIARLDDARHRLPAGLRETLLPSSAVMSQWFAYGAAKSGTGRGAGRTDGWVDRLARVGTWRIEALMDHDAEVLARLEVWNRRLIEKGAPWRILYITADHRIFRACSQYRPPELGSHSFAEAYLRHPRAYLSEEGVLGPVDPDNDVGDTEPEESVGDWLALLTQPANATLSELLDTANKHSEIPDTISVFAEGVAKDQADRGLSIDGVAADLEMKWQGFAQRALATNPITKDALLGLTSDRLRSAEELIRIVHDAHGLLEQDRRKMLRDYLRVTTRLGRKVEAVQSVSPQLRSVAPVFFEGWQRANKSIAIMSHWSDDHVEEEDYQQALDEIDKDDQTPYAFYLGNASFFAARGRWKSAALVAKRARRIGLGFHTENGFVEEARGAHGREAAYFEASCLRILAKERGELAAARECLIEAADVLEQEKRTSGYTEFVEERIPVEMVLIDFTSYLFEALVEAPEARHEPVYRDVAEAVWVQCEDQRQNLISVALGEPIEVGSEIDVRLRVELQLLITVISLAFLPDATFLDCYRARTALARLDQRIKDGQVSESALSEFDRAALFAARARDRLGRVDGKTKRDFRSALETIRKDQELRPYEAPLLERLETVSASPWLRD